MAIEPVSKIWMDGELVNWEDAKIHVLTHALHYGSGVFEGIRCYQTDRGPAVFRLTEHIRRLHDSAKIIFIDVPYTVEQLVEATKETVRVNELESCYIRPIVYLGYGEMGLNPLPCPVNVSISMWRWGAYLGEEGIQNGITAKISSWVRPDHNSIPPASKVTGAYVNSSLAKVEAIKAGYEEAIMLNRQGVVAEGTGENIFVVDGDTLITPPTSAQVLKGITADSVRTIATDMGLTIREANLTRSDLYTAEEVFVTGTAAEITPIRSIDDREIGEPGAVTRKIQETFQAAVRGKVDRYSDWNEYV